MQMIRTAQHPWQPRGTVYGALLNFQREWNLWAPRMSEDPHKGAPKAPVLYVKPANTFSPAGQSLRLQDGVTEVDIGATMGLVIGIGTSDMSSGTALKNLAFRDIVFPKPVIIGDTLRAETEVIAKHETTEHPHAGIVVFEHRGYNQRGELVARVGREVVLRKR